MNQLLTKVPKKVFSVMDTLISHGYEAYIVGGAVRDLVMDIKPHDWDIATNAKPDEVCRLFQRTINTGIKHGTVTAMIQGEGYEITTYRSDGIYSDGRHPDSVKFVSTIEEDLARRDFTINAMAIDRKGNLVDPFNGLEDIKEGYIRCVGDPNKRFEEDALRMLRAIRFLSRFQEFSIAFDTLKAIRCNAERLKGVSAERIRDELTKILVANNASLGLTFAYNTGITSVVLPEFDVMVDCDQYSPWHYTNVGQHSLDVVKAVKPESNVRWAALLHDAGKPKVKTHDDQTRQDHFYNHPDVSAEIADEVLRRLKFSNAEREKIVRLVKIHDVILETPSKIRKFAADNKDILNDFKDLIYADAQAHAPGYIDKLIEAKDKFTAKIEEYISDGSAITEKDLKIKGQELIEIGIQGPWIKEFFSEVYKECLGQPEHNNENYLKARAYTFYDKNIKPTIETKVCYEQDEDELEL